jgi:hypothetical protein
MREPIITARRSIPGSLTWIVTEFDSDRVLLSMNTPGATFQAHFSREDWEAFQALVAREGSDD